MNALPLTGPMICFLPSQNLVDLAALLKRMGARALARSGPTRLITGTRDGASRVRTRLVGRCIHCRRAHSDTQRAFGRARAQKRLPVELRQQLLDAIYAGQPFR